ncbi:hypothetical protein T01_3250 [Trichinella spiralis]|uniref:Uncharacterized protein n=1 Tax=Trichinella spiralis TaxID=6334 RepID=A0A0V1B8C0_TRISP|nr:hypothetical protein T01_3250 [Trichinella spiralis]
MAVYVIAPVAGRESTLKKPPNGRARQMTIAGSKGPKEWQLNWKSTVIQIGAFDIQLTRCKRAAHWRSERATRRCRRPELYISGYKRAPQH